MITEKEYLLLSIASYCNFTPANTNLYLKEAFSKLKLDEYRWTKFKVLSSKTYEKFLKFFKEELEEWEIFCINDKRATNKENKRDKTGFYSISYKKNDEIVIAFRGSEIFPYEEAYKDFIENNLVLGIGKRPKQFDNAIEIYEQHIYKYSLKKEKLHITGHSLGGGIAQYIAAYSNKKYGYIPETVTWNAVGINKKGIFTVEDFIHYNQVLENSDKIEKKWIKILESFKSQYYSILESYIENSKTSLDKYFESKVKMDIVFNLCLTRITTNSEEKTRIKNILIDVLTRSDDIIEKISSAKKFIIELKDNTVYKEKVINYGHSKDITFNVFEHIGLALKVDDDFKVAHSKKIFNLILDKEKFFTDYHFDDVFLPFFHLLEEGSGRIAYKIGFEYVSSMLRFFFYEEEGFSKEILAIYYSIEREEELNYELIKEQILLGLKKTKIEMLYKDKVREYIENSDLEKIAKIWKEAKKRMPSPYIAKDIYDVIIY